MRLVSFFAVCCCAAIAVPPPRACAKDSDAQKAVRAIAKDSPCDFVRVFYDSQAVGKRQGYGIFVPASYDAKKPAPLVVFLHSWWTDFEDKQWLRVTEIPGTIQDQCNRRGWVAIAPEANGNSWYAGKAEAQVLETVDQIQKYVNVDANRLYLVGRSMGGAGALSIAVHHPDRVAGVVALAGVSDYVEYCNGNKDLLLGEKPGSVRLAFEGLPGDKPEVYRSMSAIHFADTLKKMPVYLIHGEADDIVPVKQSQALIKLLEPGGKLKYKLVPGEKHNMEMIEWFAADYFKFLDDNPPAKKKP